jgi:V-type H+-transporting ATPase subunit d
MCSFEDHKRHYPTVGHLYPSGTFRLTNVLNNEEELGHVLALFPQYALIWNVHAVGADKSIDNAFYERDMEALELAFENQMHFEVFYACVKLQEQEIRIIECILQSQKDEIHKFVPMLSHHAPCRTSAMKAR